MSAEHQLSFANNEQERETIAKQVQADKESLTGNIDKVSTTITQLIEQLSTIDNLDQLLNDGGESTLDYKYYFTDFTIDKGDGYIGNNFGQDLRNFKRFLDYAKSKGTITVYFSYG